MFQDGSDRLPACSPPTPSDAPGRPAVTHARSAGTETGPRESNAHARRAVDAPPRNGRPRSADGPTPAGPVCSDAEAPVTLPGSFSPPANRSWRSVRGKYGRRPTVRRPARSREEMRDRAPPPGRRTESRGRTIRSSPFASGRFHVLLNSLFKVLFNFPSRYLFAIGLVPVFSLRWSLPPALGCNLKQPDS